MKKIQYRSKQLFDSCKSELDDCLFAFEHFLYASETGLLLFEEVKLPFEAC